MKTRNLSSSIEIGDSTSHIYGVVLWCSPLISHYFHECKLERRNILIPKNIFEKLMGLSQELVGIGLVICKSITFPVNTQ